MSSRTQHSESGQGSNTDRSVSALTYHCCTVVNSNCIFSNLQLQAVFEWINKIRSPQNTLVHQHRLVFSDVTSTMLSENQNGIWRCAVCKNTSDALSQTFSYHCVTCGDFNICRDCFKPKRHPSHAHELKVVNTSLVYAHKDGRWVCDICENSSRWYEKYVIILVFIRSQSTGISNG